jgi:hypothetical protein
MSGAHWVKERLELAGWSVEVAHARKVSDIAPLACKTDKVDARVLAELCRRDLVRTRLGSLARRPGAPRAPSPPRPPGQAPDLASQPDLRPAHPVRPANPPAAAAPTGRAGAPRAPPGPRGLAPLDRRAPRGDSRARSAHRPARPRARAARRLGPQGPAAVDDPRRRPADQPHPRRRDRRRLALLVPLQAGRLRRACAEDHPVG